MKRAHQCLTHFRNLPVSAYHSPHTRPVRRVVTQWRIRDYWARPAVPTWAVCNCSAPHCWRRSSRFCWDRCSSWVDRQSADPAPSHSCDNCPDRGVPDRDDLRRCRCLCRHRGLAWGCCDRRCPYMIYTSGGWCCCCWRWSGRLSSWGDLDCAPGVDQET